MVLSLRTQVGQTVCKETMKISINNFLAFLMVACLLLLSCNHQGGEPAEVSFEVTPVSLTLDPQGGQDFIYVRSGEDWLMRSDVKWVKVVTSSGKASSDGVRAAITYEANISGAAREGTVSVKTLKGASVQVKVSQDSFSGQLSERGISTAEDLLAFAQAVNEGASLTPFLVDGVVTLLNDIDVSSIKDWAPAGTQSNPFTGPFDGKGYTIRNINWNVDLSEYPDAGIFGYARNANITGLKVGVEGDVCTLAGSASAVNAGAVAGRLDGGSVTGCVNNIQLSYEGGKTGGDVCLAGICGRSNGEVSECTNNGNVISKVVSRAAGFVAYNEGIVSGCTNKGCILAERSGETGPAWACSYQKNPADFVSNTGLGHVGYYSAHKDNPESADWDAYLNAVASPAREGYDLEQASIDCTKESYLNWKEEKTLQLSSGVKYTHYDCINTPLKINILEIDLSDPAVEVTASYANDCVPNPNGNNNSNNGFKVRETLSQLCERKRSEGQNIIAGVNSGFFDSNEGISRGFHIEEGEPVYINNPDVVKGLPNHSWGITIFEDRTAACSKKQFTGRLRTSGQEFRWYSLNDTIMRNVSSSYQINLYDSHYKQYPHPSNTKLTNKLAKNALYVIAEYDGDPMKVNKGYASATVVSISDGRSSALTDLPYITSDRQIGISLSGAKADEFKTLVSVGSTVEFCCDMTIEGEDTRPIYTQCSSMFELMKDGASNLSTLPSNHDPAARDPRMVPIISKDKQTLWFVQADGRQGWYSCGISHREMMIVARKLGGYNATNLDGGGSSTMWVYDPAGKGSVVNSVSDSKGERSCLNYILIKAK